jgi:hypothetical protein
MWVSYHLISQRRGIRDPPIRYTCRCVDWPMSRGYRDRFPGRCLLALREPAAFGLGRPGCWHNLARRVEKFEPFVMVTSVFQVRKLAFAGVHTSYAGNSALDGGAVSIMKSVLCCLGTTVANVCTRCQQACLSKYRKDSCEYLHLRTFGRQSE